MKKQRHSMSVVSQFDCTWCSERHETNNMEFTLMPVLWQHLEHTHCPLDWDALHKETVQASYVQAPYSVCVSTCMCTCVSIKIHESHKHISDVKGDRLVFKIKQLVHLFVSAMCKHHEMRHGTWPNTKNCKGFCKSLFILKNLTMFCAISLFA